MHGHFQLENSIGLANVRRADSWTGLLKAEQIAGAVTRAVSFRETPPR